MSFMDLPDSYGYPCREQSTTIVGPTFEECPMPESGEINRLPGFYRSVCCGVERAIAVYGMFPPCPGCGKLDENRCAGPYATWAFIR